MKSTIRILIADEYPVFRYGLTHILNAEPDLEVIGEAHDKSGVIEKVKLLQPDVIVLEMELGDSHGVDVVRAIREITPLVRIILYTAYQDIKRIADAIAFGIQGYLLKNSHGAELVEAIRNVYKNESILDPQVAKKLLQYLQHRSNGRTSKLELLSKREHQVLDHIAQGSSNRKIAERLFISERTVKFHVSAILNKLHADNRTDAVLIAAKRGIVEVDDLQRRKCVR